MIRGLKIMSSVHGERVIRLVRSKAMGMKIDQPHCMHRPLIYSGSNPDDGNIKSQRFLGRGRMEVPSE